MPPIATREVQRSEVGAVRMRPLLLLEPSWAQHPRDCARYDQLAASLGDEGWDVRIGVERPQRRSAVAEVVVQVLEHVSSTALDALETMLARHLGEALPRGHYRHGRVVIYGAAGHVLRIREVSQAEAAQTREPAL